MGPVYTPEELAERWRVSPVTVRRALMAGTLKGFQVGRQWRIPEEAVEKYEKGE